MAHILVAYDGSEHAHAALHTAATMAKSMGGTLTLLNTQIDIETRNVRRFFSHDDVVEFQNEQAGEVLKPAVQFLQEQGIKYDIKVRVGNPVLKIIEVAREDNAAYIVMGSRGMGLIGGMVLGSVSYGVLHEAPCPVVIVPSTRQ